MFLEVINIGSTTSWRSGVFVSESHGYNLLAIRDTIDVAGLGRMEHGLVFTFQDTIRFYIYAYYVW